VVGREGVEPSTSRLSGVRSNHLSYRPRFTRWHHSQREKGMPRAAKPAQAAPAASGRYPVMKGHEDGGNVLWTGGEERELLLPP
jgi:hypothetical protein